MQLMVSLYYPVDTERILNVHKTFRRRFRRLLNVLCMFNVRPVSTIYWLLVFKNGNMKYKATSQGKDFNPFPLFYIFFSHRFLFYYLFSKSHAQRNTCLIYRISYTLSFCYVMQYIVSAICIGRRFLENWFYFYSKQIRSVRANQSLIPYNIIKRALETQNL